MARMLRISIDIVRDIAALSIAINSKRSFDVDAYIRIARRVFDEYVRLASWFWMFLKMQSQLPFTYQDFGRIYRIHKQGNQTSFDEQNPAEFSVNDQSNIDQIPFLFVRTRKLPGNLISPMQSARKFWDLPGNCIRMPMFPWMRLCSEQKMEDGWETAEHLCPELEGRFRKRIRFLRFYGINHLFFLFFFLNK